MAALLLLSVLSCAGFEQKPRQALRPPAGGPGLDPDALPGHPNIVLVLTDDHRWDSLGAAGNPAIQTPVMDRLLHDGVHFRQATASVSQCHPVRASLLTGLPSFRHGVYSIETQASGVSEKFGDLAFRAVRTPTHKLIVWHDPARGDELYDLATDPRELRNLILDPAALVTARDLRARLLAWMERTEDPARSWPRKL